MGRILKLFATVLFSAVVCLPAACNKKTPSQRREGHSRRPSYFQDEAVAGAWETAEKFAKAWRDREFATAKTLFSPKIIARYPEQVLRDRILGAPNHVHKSAEISSGRRIDDDRVEFQLRLTFVSTGSIGSRVQTDDWTIVLVRYGTKWLIDEIPIPRSAVPTE